MPESKTEGIWDVIRRNLVTEARPLIRLTIIAPLVAIPVGIVKGYGWLEVIYAVAVICAICALILMFYFVNRLYPLRKWRDLTKATDLVGFEKANKESKFMPSEILGRHRIRGLSVVGNGCSKWTREVQHAKAVATFRKIRQSGGKIRFLVSCPVYLSQTGDEQKIRKARSNASSLLVLRYFKDQTERAGGTFEIKVYRHVATLRLIIVDDVECIVGHYQQDGDGDSFDTPLLVFNRDDQNEWGFGGAFHRMFDSEWHRAFEPTAEDWKRIEEISSTKDQAA